MIEHKYFLGYKYYLNKGRWHRTARPHTFLSWDVWNFYHPEDKIIKGDGQVIHHRNGFMQDDMLSNLQKMYRSEHSSLHTDGERNPFYGKTHSKETRKNMSESAKGRELSEETKQKISDSNKGKSVGPNTEEWKKKLSEVGKGKEPWSKGMQMSEEYKLKMNISRRFNNIIKKLDKMEEIKNR